jgi:hypothetical protein
MKTKLSFPCSIPRLIVFALCVAGVPPALRAQTSTGSSFTFPRFASCGNLDTGVAIFNPNPTSAVTALKVTVAGGGSTATVTVTIPALGQVIKTAGELFSGGCVDASLEISSASSGLIAWYQTFDITGIYLDGAGQALPAYDLLFPVVPATSEGLAEIDLLNSNPRVAAVELKLWSTSGTLLGTTKVQVPAFGAYRGIANDLFPAGTDFSNASHITTASKPVNLLSQAQPVSGTSLFAGFSSVPSAGAVDVGALNAAKLDDLGNSGVIPYFRTGATDASTLALVNAEPASVDVTLTAIGNYGTSIGTRRITLTANGGYRAPVPFVFSGMGAGERAGWILIQASGRVSAAVIHGRSDAPCLSAVPMQRTPASAFLFPQVVQGYGYHSDLSLVNPLSTATYADVMVTRPDGSTAAFNRVSLEPGAKGTWRLSSLMPEIESQSGGAVYVSAHDPIFSTLAIGTDSGATLASFAPQPISVPYSPAALKSFAITGNVLLNDRPAAGFRVVLSGPVGRLATSAQDGTYAFTNLPAGRYSMMVDQFGFQFLPAQTNFELTNASKRQDFQGYTAPDAIVVQPASLPAKSPDSTVTVFGTGFDATSEVHVGATRLATTYVNSGQLRAVIPAYMMLTAARIELYVLTDDLGPNRHVSSKYAFMAYQDKPVLTEVKSAGNLVEGNAGTNITLAGKGFLAGASVKVNGNADGIETTLIDEGQLVAFLPARYLAQGGIFPVTVANPYPANAESNVQLLTVFYPAPVVEATLPATVAARLESGAGPLTLEVLGYGFRRGAVVLFKGQPLATTYCESDAFCLSVHLYAKVPAGLLRESGFADIVVQNPSPSLGISETAFLTVNGLKPTITSITPGTATVTDVPLKFSLPILVAGTNFGPQTVVRVFKASDPQVPQFKTDLHLLSSMQFWTTVDVDSSAAGEWKVQVANPQPGGGQFESSFFITDASYSGNPFILSLTPGLVEAGGPGFMMVIDGTNFSQGAEVQFGTTFLNAEVESNSQIMVDIPAYLIQNAGRVPIVVVNPDTGGASNRMFLEIR